MQGDDVGGPPSLLQRAATLRKPAYVSTIVGLAVLTFGLGFAALLLTPPGGTTAIWWPAAGTSALLYLLYRGPKWQVLVLVAAVGFVSNLLIGRPLSFALWGAAILAIEIVVLGLVLGKVGHSALLSTFRGFARFVAACLAASTTVGVLAGIAFLTLVGANPALAFSSVVPSHFSALAIILPIALVPMPRGARGPRIELVLQITAITVVALLVFAPFQTSAISTLVMPFFAWAAVRFRPMIVIAEVVALAVAASVLTVFGGGPYGDASENDLPASLLVQIYLLSIALTVHILIVVNAERSILRTRDERRAALWRGGFVGSQVGTVFVSLDPAERGRVLEVNDIASSLIEEKWFVPLLEAWQVDGGETRTAEVQLDDGRTVQVHGQYVQTDDNHALVLQLVDITDFVTAQATMERVVLNERRVANELRSLSKQKDDFVSSVSHELRTPITSIVGFAEELRETATEDQLMATEVITRNADRLTEMVEQLLEIGRLTAPNPLHELSAIDLTAITQQCIEDQTASAVGRGVRVEASLADHPIGVKATTNTLTRVVTNLLSNAIKFTPSGGSVRVTTTADEATVTLTVEDSGPGISDDDLPHIFERFFRSEDATKLLTPGTGLGLSIVKSLVETHDGEIAVGRSELGGAKMTVRFPAPVVETSH
ncbi:MAG: hypothetical protein B7Y93_06015 [Micrococcales bacterium 32-70-13]|nr:MAG: hypothetical protein B7Y93_06015 [Micrococcales bacterium 32-70-13]